MSKQKNFDLHNVYIKLNKVYYDTFGIKNLFHKYNLNAQFIDNYNNLIDGSIIIIGNNEREILPYLSNIINKHQLIIIKNTFCYDTIPTANTLKYFNNIDTQKIIYFDSGIYYNIPYFKEFWESNKINYKMYKHSLLTYHLNNTIDYTTFCNKNNLNPTFKLVTFFLNSAISIWEQRDALKEYNISQNGDKYVVENFENLKEIFNKHGYNLIIKEHRDKWKQLKFYLDHIKKYGIPKNKFPQQENDNINYKYKFNRYIKPHLKILWNLYPNIVGNEHEKEIYKYSDIGLIGSYTTTGNILYDFNMKTLYLDSVENSWINVIASKLKLDINEYKNQLYGIIINIENTNNIEANIKDIINYNEPCQYLKEHPFFGCIEKNNSDYFEKILKTIKNDNII